MQTKLCGKLICFTQNRKALWRRRRQRRQRRQRRPNCCTIEHKAILINFMAHLFAWHLGALQLFVEYIPHCNFLLLENTIIIPGQVEFALLCTSRGGKQKELCAKVFYFMGRKEESQGLQKWTVHKGYMRARAHTYINIRLACIFRL